MYIDKFLRLRQLSPDPAEGGTPPAFVSLDDIDAAEEEAAKAGNTSTDLEAEAAKKAETEKAEAEAAQKKLDEEAAAKKAAEEKTGDNPDDDDPEGAENEDNFWADVDKLRGEELEVDFGDVDPTSPEGVLIYEKAVREDEIAKFEADLAATHPRAYALMTHLIEGGKEEDFFKAVGQPGELPTEEELETDIEKQKAVIITDLKAKGNTDKQIERIIKGGIEDDELEEMAKEARKSVAKRQEDAIKEVQATAERETKFKEEKIKEVSGWISNLVATGKIGDIIIPEKDRPEFAKAFSSSIRIENNQFVSVVPVTNENIQQLLKEKFFGFKKGDLSGLIQKAAKTENTKRLQRTIPTGQAKPLGTGAKADTGKVSLGELDD